MAGSRPSAAYEPRPSDHRRGGCGGLPLGGGRARHRVPRDGVARTRRAAPARHHPGRHADDAAADDDWSDRGGCGLPCRRARLPGGPRHPPADERRAAESSRRPDGRRRAVRCEPDLQPPLGRSRDVRDVGRDSRGGNQGPERRPAGAGRRSVAEPADLRLRPAAHLRPGVSARGRGLLGREQVSRFRGSRAPRSSTSPTGWAR